MSSSCEEADGFRWEKQKNRVYAETRLLISAMKSESRFWNWYAGCYDGLISTAPYRRLLEQTTACVPVGAVSLLDAGCGTGNLLAAIRRRWRAIALHGIDFSDAMLRRARSKVPDGQFLP